MNTTSAESNKEIIEEDLTRLKSIWQHPAYRFLMLFLGLFILLYYFNIFYIGIVTPGGYYSPFLDTYLNYIEGLRYVLLQSSAEILKLAGYQVFTTDIWLRVVGRGGIILAYDCLGYGVMSFFTAFVIAYPKALKSKLWFLPLGLVLIQSLNIIRFVLLSLYWRHSGLKSFIDHHDLFNIILYIALLGVMFVWVRKGGMGEKEER